MATTRIVKGTVNLTVLLYSNIAYEYKDLIGVFDKGTYYDVVIPDEASVAVCTLIEKLSEFPEYGMELTNEIIANMGNDVSKAIQKLLDDTAKAHRYDDMKSVRSYTGFDNPFRDECIAMAKWAANCWIYAGELEASVRSGARSMPTIEEVLAELPLLTI